MGSDCFFSASSFSLADLPQLQSFKLGNNEFYQCQSVTFDNLPKLQSLDIGYFSFCGDSRNSQRTTSEAPYHYRNTLTMKNLPSLTKMIAVRYNFYYFGTVVLENIPNMSSTGIVLSSNCFKYTSSLQSSNSSQCESALRSISKFIPVDATSLISPHSIEWIVEAGEYRWACMDSIVLANQMELKRIVIGNHCFGKVHLLEIDGLSELESMVIGAFSFDNTASKKTQADGICRIVNCSKLTSIQIGDYSFSDFHALELRSLPSLQSLELGSSCFRSAPLFSLTGFLRGFYSCHRLS